ncbi:MAG TPA: DUF2188 domain-containing protein [Burkholderiales bacterium]|nr:DUF2188 domain-containing protein [Burkholderiales bacterium]
MGLDQKGASVFRVCHGANRQWDVNEMGFDKPLASFDTEEDACTYANDLAETKPGSRVVVEGPEAIGRLTLPVLPA